MARSTSAVPNASMIARLSFSIMISEETIDGPITLRVPNAFRAGKPKTG
jgi:hypothetical protein